MTTENLHPVILKRLKRVEMMKHYDSHHHLITQHTNLRPVVMEAPVKAGAGENACRIDVDMISVAAALVNDTSILITDMDSMNGVETDDVNVIYLVFKSERNLDPMEHDAGPGKYKIYYHVQSIEEAFEHIRGKLTEVTEQANPKEPFGLSDLLWSFMMAREIRVVGNFQLLATALPHTDVLQTSQPSLSAKTIFDTKSIGRKTFPRNNLAKVFQTYIDNPALVAGFDDRLSDPYFNLAHQNYHAERRQGGLQVKLRRFAKNRLNRFHRDALVDTVENLVIITLDDWKNMTIKNALIILVDAHADESINILAGVEEGKNFVNNFKTFHKAIGWAMNSLRPSIEPKVGKAGRLKYIKTISVFTDVMDEAH